MENSLPKFYFINLDRSNDRLKHMEKFFKKLGKKMKLNVKFERIKAFDGKNENVDNFYNLKLKNMWHGKTRNVKAIGPEFGCTYSHIKAMKTFLNDSNNTDDLAFICEDDLELFRLDKDKFKETLDATILLAKEHELVAVSCVGSPNLIQPMINNTKAINYVDYNENRGRLYGTGCYMITRTLAKKIVNKYLKDDKLILDKHHETMVADHFIYPLAKKTKFMIPSLFAIKPENDSYIHSEHTSMHDNVQKLMYLLWYQIGFIKK